ncbi:MAG: RNA pseudouridine synthase [Clostridia bacterium]|nr:RNA pseudouridine synthase [Clostridia bacterium]
MLNIVYKSKRAVVIYKPHGMPAQPDPSGDTDAMTATAAMLAEGGERGDLWLINRLDRGVGGLMIFARDKKTAAILSETVRDRQITKEYFAVVAGIPEGDRMVDFLYKDTRTSKAYIVKSERKGVKKASLSFKTVAIATTDRGDLSLVAITLDTGRFHQIRAQFSYRGHSIVGDKKYGSTHVLRGGIALVSCHLAVDIGDEKIDVRVTPDTATYPWSLFADADFSGV